MESTLTYVGVKWGWGKVEGLSKKEKSERTHQQGQQRGDCWGVGVIGGGYGGINDDVKKIIK